MPGWARRRDRRRTILNGRYRSRPNGLAVNVSRDRTIYPNLIWKFCGGAIGDVERFVVGAGAKIVLVALVDSVARTQFKVDDGPERSGPECVAPALEVFNLIVQPPILGARTAISASESS